METESFIDFSEQLNANNYAPVDGAGDNGQPVKLSEVDERLSDDTFPINQVFLVFKNKIVVVKENFSNFMWQNLI